MAYPASLDDLNAGIGASGNPLSSPNHITQHTNEVAVIEALETKVGIDNSAVTTTIDYKLKNSASVNPGHKHSLLAGISDVAIVTPITGNGLIYNSVTSKWENGAVPTPDASTTVKGLSKINPAPASATEPIALGANFATKSGTALDNTSNKIIDEASGELLANKDTTVTLGTSDTKYPSQKAVRTYVDNGDFQEVTISTVGSNVWICPRGVTTIYFDGVGGGGGGGGSTGGDTLGGGGGGGAGLKNQAVTVVPLTTYTIVIGDKGAGQTGGNGTVGGNTTAFGYTMNGGGGGVKSSSATGGTAGDATAGAGGNGGGEFAYGSNGNVGTGGGTGGTGGQSNWGGGGGGASGITGTGGNGGQTGTPNGSVGGIGCGGGGAMNTGATRAGSDGGQGLVIIKIPTRQLY